MPEKRTSRKSESNKAVRKMLSMKADFWSKADEMADDSGTTRSAIVAESIEMLWRARKNDEKKDA
ncbi:MAG: hypothetical protein HDQ91_01355 [Desulfovibrio sp.]|nr:hypothetical protein [Desulfovibrio sp.]